MTPSFASGSPLRIWCLLKRSLTFVLRLFSFTFARIAQESIERYFAEMIFRLISFWTRSIRIFYRFLLSASLRKAENLSTVGIGFVISKPHRRAALGLSLRVFFSSLSGETLLRFFKIRARSRLRREKGFLPVYLSESK